MNKEKTSFVLGKKNAYTILVGFLVVVLGFVLMSGGKGTSPDEFVEAEIFSTTRLTIAPITVVTGFLIVGVGIMLKPNQSLVEEESNPS